MIYSYETEDQLSDLGEVVAMIVGGMRERMPEYDSIAVRGVSGLLVGSPVSLALKVPLVVVRKPGEGTHDYRRIVNSGAIGKATVFLDDFRSSGATEQAVREAARLEGADIAACFFYNRSPGVRPEWAEPLHVASAKREAEADRAARELQALEAQSEALMPKYGYLPAEYRPFGDLRPAMRGFDDSYRGSYTSPYGQAAPFLSPSKSFDVVLP